MHRDEDDQQVPVCRGELALKIKTTFSRQSDLEYQASGAFARLTCDQRSVRNPLRSP
jgi:hypothetical protein